MTATRSMITAESLVASQTEAMRLSVLLSGVLDAKIVDCRKAMAELDERKKLVTMLEDEIKAKAAVEVDAMRAQAKADADALLAAARKNNDDALARQRKVDASEQALGVERARLAKIAEEFRQTDEAQATRAASLEALGHQLDQRLEQINQAETKLKGDRQVLNARLDSLKLPI